MADYVATTEDFKAVANAIRTKGGTSAPLRFPDEFASAIQAIPGPKPEQEKELTITENGDVTITADVGKVLSKVLAHVNVPTGGGGGSGGDIKPFSKIVVNTVTLAADSSRITLDKSQYKLAAAVAFTKYTMDLSIGDQYIGLAAAITSGQSYFNGFGEDVGASILLKATLSGQYIGAYLAPNNLFGVRGGKKFKAGIPYVVVLFYA